MVDAPTSGDLPQNPGRILTAVGWKGRGRVDRERGRKGVWVGTWVDGNTATVYTHKHSCSGSVVAIGVMARAHSNEEQLQPPAMSAQLTHALLVYLWHHGSWQQPQVAPWAGRRQMGVGVCSCQRVCEGCLHLEGA